MPDKNYGKNREIQLDLILSLTLSFPLTLSLPPSPNINVEVIEHSQTNTSRRTLKLGEGGVLKCYPFYSRTHSLIFLPNYFVRHCRYLLPALIWISVLEWPVHCFLKTESSLTNCRWRTLGATAPVTINMEFQVPRFKYSCGRQ